MILSIEVDEADRAELERILTPSQYRQAMFQAVRRTTNAVARNIKKEFKDRAGHLKGSKDHLKKAVKVRPPKGDRHVGSVTVTGERIPLIAFKTKVLKRTGVIANISPGQPPITLRHAFKATMKSGHVGIFQRAKHLPKKGPRRGKGKLTARGFAGRFAIVEATGPSVFGIVNVPEVLDQLTFDAAAEMKKNLVSQLDRFLPRDGERAFPTPILSA